MNNEIKVTALIALKKLIRWYGDIEV